ncbi:MAG: hypothetical protein J1F12_05180 [Muribaculaceae bacterium]|nr:hypothetical protein [Muribaculaceae bacterium]
MSRHSYSASERRGILAIALVALIIIAAGIVLPLCSRRETGPHELPVVIEHTELIDSTSTVKSHQTRGKAKSGINKAKESKTKTKKSYRRRSPLDEPV